MSTQLKVATALLDVNAVVFLPDKPITFKTGLISPVYVDNRKLPFNPSQWAIVLAGFKELLKRDQVEFDILSGVETAGIPHSAVLGFLLHKPSVFVRKAAKDHGTKKMVEGGDVVDKRVLLIEDHVTTGSSSLKAVEVLRQAGAIVTDCLCVTSYTFPEVDQAFAQAKVTLHTLTSFETIFKAAIEMSKITPAEVATVQDWLNDPHNWAKKHGFARKS